MKKLLALLMAMAMLLSLLVGCGGDDEKKVEIGETKELNEETLVGEWDMVIDFNKALSIAGGIPGISDLSGQTGMDVDAMLEAFGDIDFSDMRIGVTFTSDGEMVVDMEDTVDALVAMLDEYIEWLGKGDNLYDFVAKTTGMSKAQVKAELDKTGMTVDSYLALMSTQFDQIKETMMDSMSELADEAETIYYELDGNRIYTESESGEANGYYEFKYDGKIHITEINSMEQTSELEIGVLYFE